MQEHEWRDRMGDLVRDSMMTDTYRRYYELPLTDARAAIYICQLGLFVRHRRDCWAYVSGNSPVISVKQAILQHEYEEIVEDEYSAYGHLDLVVRQAQSVGVTAGEIMDAKPLATTRAALYSWAWLTRERPWQEGLAALMATERGNDNRLLEDLGGGHSRRQANKWMKDLGLSWGQVPNAAAHSQADEKHADMFLPALAEHTPPDQEAKVLQAAKESLQLRELMYLGITEAMAKV